ncbi:hypothetical protein PYW08_011771 [Mythimna loreyi]|uniref:Uncharacterized protein n=1 Tax=Mythimna loreyi TaxID=667449 RepID=A0ACC2QKF0_9NEOP|nr:hypothetical protein PYW08_011771 [Mythimna loreyi]
MAMFSYEDNSFVKMILSSYNVLVHLLLGVLIAIPLLFAVVQKFYATSVPDNIIMLHILLCVPGYQLLMSQAFLCLCPYNAWSSHLKRSNKIHAHWILQLLGSAMAITGSIVIMIYKDVNFNTTHGRLGLVAVIFTTMSLLTGVPTFFSESLKRFIPSTVSKLTHIVLGITSFALASACLCHAYNKFSFRTWTGDQAANGVIAFTAIFTFIMSINPLITMCKRIYSVVEAYRTRY